MYCGMNPWKQQRLQEPRAEVVHIRTGSGAPVPLGHHFAKRLMTSVMDDRTARCMCIRIASTFFAERLRQLY
jgi:hypothetical protein